MLLIPLALAAPPSIDTPLRTGVSAPADAAVVIGIERYPNLGRDVPYAEADARAMADLLVYTRGIPPLRVQTLAGNTAREDIVAAVQQLGLQVHSGGTLFVYFAGHGAGSGEGRTLLGADVKANTASFAARSVSMTELARLGSGGGGRVVLLVDACFGGAARDGADLLAGTRFAVPVDLDAGQWAATIENQVAQPLPEAGHGLFTYLAVGAMRGWADGELSGRRDGVVTADEAQRWMEATLAGMGERNQTPRLAPDLGGFVLTRGVKEAVDEVVLASVRGTQTSVAPVGVARTSGGFGDLSLDVSAKVRQQECDQEALRLGTAARSARLDAQAKQAAAEASAAWRAMSTQAKACEALDAASRADCAKSVDAFVARAEALKVTLSAGEEPVTTKCGAARPAFSAESRAVSVAELAEAKAEAGRLKGVVRSTPLTPVSVGTKPGGPVTTEAELAVTAAVAAPSAPLSANSPLVDTGMPGFGDEVVTIPGGTFLMGTPVSEKGRSNEEQHQVTLSSFLMARTEVSQALWTKVMGTNPSVTSDHGAKLVGERLPVQNVSWCDVVDFANRLSMAQGMTEVYDGVSNCESTGGASVAVRNGALGWRLPTESEWEYAARAGTTGVWGAMSDEGAVCGIGNVDDKSAAHFGMGLGTFKCDDGRDGLAPVGSYRANEWGLFDVTGNVWEWTSDWHDDYPRGAVTNPTGASSGSFKVSRGGSWISMPADTRVGDRRWGMPRQGGGDLGLRLARSVP